MDTENGYRKLVEAVELRELALVDLAHHRDIQITPPLTVTHELEIHLESFSAERIVAVAEFALRARPEHGQSDQVSIRMTWRLVYELNAREGFEPDEGLAKQFVERNVPINLWPYVRETVATLTAKMGLAPLLLPILKIIR